jgi:hypothetical protein
MPGDLESGLVTDLTHEPWFNRLLFALGDAALPDAWIGGAVVRDVVWGRLCGGFDPGTVQNVHVAFFDTSDLSPDRDVAATERLRSLLPGVPWEATNQAAVHTWYHERYGGDPIKPFSSVEEAVATWQETAICLAVRRLGTFEVLAPIGLEDLMGGVWRRNPRGATREQSRARLEQQRVRERWPAVRVVEP